MGNVVSSRARLEIYAKHETIKERLDDGAGHCFTSLAIATRAVIGLPSSGAVRAQPET